MSTFHLILKRASGSRSSGQWNDALSGGRFVLGIGPSGPQVVEGWHGVAYGKPLLLGST
jgi:hypothetical protein